MNQYLKTIQDLLQQNSQLSNADKEALLKSIVDADKQWSITEFKLDRTEKVKKTTAILLEETIEELEQKRKAVEAQNKELEIEASLERVRAVAMGMKKPDELLSICEVLFRELQILGFGELRNALIHTFVDEQNYFNDYDYSDFAGGAITRAPYTGHPVVEKFIEEIKKEKDAFSENVVAGKELEDWKGFRTAHGQAHDPRLDGIPALYYYMYSIGPADIGISTFSAISNDKRELLKRFRNVFDLAYRRYTDIQQAEEQARESQIQLALERVRARTMAMQKSDELREAVLVIYEQLRLLNFESNACNIIIIDKESGSAQYWVSGFSQEIFPVSYNVPYLNHPYSEALLKPWKQGDKYNVYEYSGKMKQSFDKIFFTETDFKNVPEKAKKMMMGLKSVMLSTAFISYGALQVIGAEPLSVENAEILQRFGKVFEQTYTRFLDLEKAEAQAREAKIEAALERTRTQSMIMQHSKELDDTLRVFHEQVLALGINSAFSFLWLPDEEKDRHIFWAAWGEDPPAGEQGKNGSTVFKSKAINYPLDRNEPATAQCLIDWKSAGPVHSYHVPPAAVDNYFAAWKELIDGVEKLKPEYFSGGLYYVEAFMKYGCFGVMVENELSEDEKKILLRFSIEFERTYTRFLDLQKAEVQAREAQIEAALERVRSRTMGMQKSDELREVAVLLYRQFLSLGVSSVLNCGYVEVDEINNIQRGWMTKTDGSPSESFKLPLTGDPVFQNRYDSWKRKDAVFHQVVTGDELKRHIEFSRPTLGSNEVEELVVTKFPDSTIFYCGNFSNGYLHVIAGTLLSKEEESLLERFTRVFDQTYTRFLDLEKAEAQTREAQIEASLERVRASAMAMHRSDELSNVLAVLFEQFDVLKIQPVDVHLDLFDLEKNTFSYRATGKEGKRVIAEQIVDLDSRPEWQALLQKWKNGKPNTVDFSYYPKEVIKELMAFFPDIWAAMPEDAIMSLEDFPDGIFDALGFCKFGYIGFHHHRKATEEEQRILIRFANEFERLYQRFLDLQKAEAQAREAQIEAALERVRSRSLAMHKSDELRDVVKVVFKNLEELKFAIDGAAFIGIPIEGSRDVNIWIGDNHAEYPTCFRTPFYDTPHIADIWKAMESGLDFYSRTYNKEEKNAGFTYAFQNTDYKYLPDQLKKWILEQEYLTQSFAIAKNSTIGIHYHTKRELTDDEIDILKRFSIVFDQSYIRFRDLQKAEAQAREAQIEAALEKVRSRSLAMHRSDELEEVIMVVSEQLQQLQFRFHNASFVRYNEQQGLNFWLASPGQPQPYLIEVPYLDNPIYTRPLEALKNGVDFIADVLTAEENHEWLDHLLKYSVLKNVPEDDKKFLRGTTGFARSLVLTKNIILVIGNYAALPYTDEQNRILKRFGHVFEQAYTRFLDLQKAEAQAREARIENALEKVRSRTMAMQRSAELAEVATVLFQQVKALGVPQWTCGFSIFEIDDKEFTWYPGSADGEILPPVKIPLTEHPVFISFNESRKRGDELFVYEKEGEYQAGHYRYMQSLPGVREMLQKMLDAGLSFPTFQIDHLAHFSHGTLVFITYEPVPEMHDVFKRFAKVFEQTYTRFLDLQKAEAQAREAQIELGLERVRARAMAMQNSVELKELIGTVFIELTKLDIVLTRCVIMIYDTVSNDSVWWMANSEAPADPIGLHIKYHDHAPYVAYINAWREKNLKWTYVLEGADKKSWDNFLFAETELSHLPDFVIDGMKAPGRVYLNSSFNTFGNLTLASLNPLSNEHFDIMLRFAKVFDLTYTRFNDLQKAEAQALEATKRASVDRVRAEIASMRTTSDLERIQPLIWNELKTLDVPFIRCGVFIMDEEKQEVQTMLSTPGGQAIATLHVPFEFDLSIITNGVKYWRKKKVYTEHWNAAAFTKVWIKLSSLRETSMDSPQTERPPESLHLHMLPFLQGMLYVGSETPLNDEQLQLVQNLAEAFSTAYARYEDFNKLEAAKKQVDNTLNELQVTQKQLIQSEKMASLGELTAGIAHEIQNPLNFVNNFSDVSHELLDEMKVELEKGNKEDAMAIAEDVKHNLEKILHHGKRADAIVKGMLQHSRTGSGQKELTDINALADEYLRLAYHGLRAKDKSFNAALHHDFDKSIDKVYIIPQDIGRVLVNLINNAFYAVNAKARKNIPGYEPALTITTKKIADNVELRVSDNGIGIPPKVLDKIFHPFFTTKPTGQGTGLGLSMAYDIITKGHGGELKVRTKEGEGSEFCIKIPVSKTPA